jgi:phosphate uptake regulator
MTSWGLDGRAAGVAGGAMRARTFARELQGLERRLLTMRRLVAEQIADAVRMLAPDAPRGGRPALRESALDALRARIEEQCFSILARHPRATRQERRVLGTVIRIATALERIGDVSMLMLERATARCPPACPGETSMVVQLMAANALDMVTRGVVAFSTRNAELAATVRHVRPVVDGFGERVVYDVLRAVRDGGRRPEGLELSVLVIAHHLEQVAEHAVGIAERVVSLLVDGPRGPRRSGPPRSDVVRSDVS